MTSLWDEAARVRWYEDNPGPHPEEFVTHVVTYRPEFRVSLMLPPWMGPEEAEQLLDEAVAGWSEMLDDHGGHWTEPLGDALLVEVTCRGATASSERPIATVEVKAGVL